MRMVGDVIRGASEAIEVQNRLAQARRDEKRGDGKVFALLGLARFDADSGDHCLAASAWLRPFHSPPLPRQC
jgi:hypothetical protein